MENRYNKVNAFFKNKFKERTLKICVNGGFSCPNRTGKCGTGGCIFCSENGSGDNIKFKNISEQVNYHLSSYRGKRANKFIVYFQNFSNTFDSVQVLKQKYESALISDKIVGLAIATRPDCITDEICKLLYEFSKKLYVYVELGLQTSNDETARFINRGYNSVVFSQAVKMLNSYNIDVVAHIMLGLPKETLTDVQNTITFLNKEKISGIKIHCTYVVKNTTLATLYNKKLYEPLTSEEYLEQLVYVITHINKDVIIHRITGDPPKNLLIAPLWTTHKKLVLNGLDKILKENNLTQGMYYSPDNL